MHTRSFKVLRRSLVLLSAMALACSSSTPSGGGHGGAVSATGGHPGSVGQTAGSGGSATSNSTGTGGTTASGGVTTTGGLAATGGKTGAGGTTSAGGSTAAVDAAAGGQTGIDGGTTTGGVAAAGGKTGTGGTTSAGGTTATGGTAAGGQSGTSGYALGNPPVPSSGCSKTLSTFKTGQSTYKITSSGKSREYIMTIPTSYDATHPYRLVFGMHWMNGSDTAVANDDHYYKLLPLDTDNTTVFVAPQGYASADGSPWSSSDASDQIFFEDLVSALASSLCIDTTRIFSVGFSFGAMFSNSLGRNHQLSNASPKNVLRGVAVYETAIRNIYQGTPTGNPMAWWGQVGMSDPLCTPADGHAARDEWAKNNGCTVPATVPEWTSGNHLCYSYDCPSNYPVRWCTFDGNHTDWATDSGSSTPWEPEETWKFITQF